MSKKTYAPVILFTYRRLKTLKRTINSLQKNNISNNTQIYIFSDGPKNSNDYNDVIKVRNYLKKIKNFKQKKIIFRKKNIGLAKNIIDGTTQVLSLKKKAIILEDDILVSENFLEFMNYCLDTFNDNKKIWHINGWNYPIELNATKEDIFYWRGMHCWGWATWSNRWKKFQKNPEKLINSFSKDQKHKFNYDGNTNFWGQIKRNYDKKIDTWAIFWYASIFKNKGLCVSPKESCTFNIGNDKFATNMLDSDKSINSNYKKKFNKKNIFTRQEKFEENLITYNQIKKHIKFNRLKNILLNLFK